MCLTLHWGEGKDRLWPERAALVDWYKLKPVLEAPGSNAYD